MAPTTIVPCTKRGLKQHLRQLWLDAGYANDIGSCELLAPPPKDTIRLYHMTTAAHGVSNISSGRVKVFRFSQANDPFELLSPSFGDPAVRNFIEPQRVRINDELGLLCLSGNWTNPVLWGHYASKHSGICLGFDVPRNLALKVEYRAKRFIANLSAPPSDLKLLRMKYRHWSYECEHRFKVELAKAHAEGQLHFHQFGPDLKLAEVILGVRCTIPDEIVRTLVDQSWPNAITYRAALSFKKFEVVPDAAAYRLAGRFQALRRGHF